MTISNQASGVRTGVCTSSTRPTAPYNGQVIYETDTGRSLVWNNSAWVYLATNTANPVGLELITTQTIGASVSTVPVNNCFSAAYDNYKIMVQGGSASGNTGYLTLQLGAATSNYRYDYVYASMSATMAAIGTVAGSKFDHVGFASTTLMASIDVIGPFGTGMTMVSCPAGRTGNDTGFMAGVQIDSTSFTGFTLGSSVSPMTGGTIRVYGYKN